MTFCNPTLRKRTECIISPPAGTCMVKTDVMAVVGNSTDRLNSGVQLFQSGLTLTPPKVPALHRAEGTRKTILKNKQSKKEKKAPKTKYTRTESSSQDSCSFCLNKALLPAFLCTLLPSGRTHTSGCYASGRSLTK